MKQEMFNGVEDKRPTPAPFLGKDAVAKLYDFKNY